MNKRMVTGDRRLGTRESGLQMKQVLQKKSSSKILLERYDTIFGQGTAQKLLESQKNISKKQFFRVNLSKTNNAEIETFFEKNKIEFKRTFIPNCLEISHSFFSVNSSLPALEGKIYSQDIASQIPANLIDFERFKGKIVNILDMAASPGSKTTQIADIRIKRNQKYEITALEIEQKRLQKLINNIQKQKFENIKIINIGGEKFNSHLKYDIILLDAPCSGNLVGDTTWLSKRDINGILENSKLQKKLLENASKLLSENGILVYSTCSLEVEENEENVDYALRALGLKPAKTDFKLPFNTKPVTNFKGKKLNVGTSFRLMPYESQTQGFFISIFEKK